MDARRSTLTGVLRIKDGRAGSRSGNGVIELQPILSVEKGRRGSDFMNRWIEIQYGDPEQPSTAYLSDGGWRGWRPILTRSNHRILTELSALSHKPANWVSCSGSAVGADNGGVGQPISQERLV